MQRGRPPDQWRLRFGSEAIPGLLAIVINAVHDIHDRAEAESSYDRRASRTPPPHCAHRRDNFRPETRRGRMNRWILILQDGLQGVTRNPAVRHAIPALIAADLSDSVHAVWCK